MWVARETNNASSTPTSHLLNTWWRDGVRMLRDSSGLVPLCLSLALCVSALHISAERQFGETIRLADEF